MIWKEKVFLKEHFFGIVMIYKRNVKNSRNDEDSFW